ncbi:MAG TPA: succinate dehydrogenase cytochrome b subunit [Flavilitoribacter sp.]|nr:succinate dehydrogenase cytochrome b subunit [Flavilitoribacter sp.]HMQ87323.1 succinate dehydrogenase cytochrome b subunit [Flavilitoribacter sp.]
MNWFLQFLTSSIGRKVIMSLTGIFLILFLIVHLLGNLQLLHDDGGKAFNLYAKFMTTNPLVKTISYLLYLSILIHAVQGWAIWRKNRSARGAGYAVKVTRAVNTNARAASNMGWLGTVIFIFILIHLYQFWLQMKLNNLPMAEYDGKTAKDLYAIVAVAYQNLGYVVFYVVSMAVIAFHLAHGFQSAFQTLGLNHKKYTPAIQFLGRVYAIAVPALFALIPVYMYLFMN